MYSISIFTNFTPLLVCTLEKKMLIWGIPVIKHDLSLQNGWDLIEQSERCASILKVVGLNPSGGSEPTLRSDLLFTARGSIT
jgi:hypothetical protein